MNNHGYDNSKNVGTWIANIVVGALILLIIGLLSLPVILMAESRHDRVERDRQYQQVEAEWSMARELEAEADYPNRMVREAVLAVEDYATHQTMASPGAALDMKELRTLAQVDDEAIKLEITSHVPGTGVCITGWKDGTRYETDGDGWKACTDRDKLLLDD